MSTVISDQNKFNFFVPANIEKGSDKEGNEVTWIDGIASTSRAKDSDQETLFPSGFDFTQLLESGFFNYNHKANITSKAIVGQPTEAKVINSGQDFWVKGFIYPNEEGKNIVDLANTLKQFSPDRKIGFSIEGVATSRDPFDKKKITGAMITGIAITVQPKNKNTLMNIVKGEYAAPFAVDEIECEKCGDKECECIKKDMSTESMEPITPESVEGAPKDFSNINTNKFGKLIKKSEIYTAIINKYNSKIAETKKIYSFVEATNQKLFSMITTETTPKEISEAALNKSFELLDEAFALLKGTDGEAITNTTGDNGAGTTIVKSEEASTEDIEKSVPSAQLLFKAGIEKDAACDIMVKGGIALNVAQGAWESVLASANAGKQGGDTSTVAAPIVKSEDQVNVSDAINKAIAPLNGVILKSLESIQSTNALIKSLSEQNTTLQTNYTELNGKFEKIAGTSQGRKSVVTSTAVDRFNKGEDTTELKAGEEIFDITKKADLARLVTRIDAENDNIMSKGKDADQLLIKAIEAIEICNEVPQFAYARLRSMGCILQKPE